MACERKWQFTFFHFKMKSNWNCVPKWLGDRVWQFSDKRNCKGTGKRQKSGRSRTEANYVFWELILGFFAGWTWCRKKHRGFCPALVKENGLQRAGRDPRHMLVTTHGPKRAVNWILGTNRIVGKAPPQTVRRPQVIQHLGAKRGGPFERSLPLEYMIWTKSMPIRIFSLHILKLAKAVINGI